MNTQQTKQLAKDLGIDKAVRIIAGSGKNNNRINFWEDWGGLAFTATFGAGTNSARVRVDDESPCSGMVLYAADDYGRHIETFRPGNWVNRFINHANIIKGVNGANQLLSRVRQARKEQEKFSDFNI